MNRFPLERNKFIYDNTYMNRVVHFEIEADDIDRAKTFYGSVFGWTFEDYSQYVNSEYWGVVSGQKGEEGINGGMMKRSQPVSEGASNAYVCSIVVNNYDSYHQKILDAGGKCVISKLALPGMAWQGYYVDTEGNRFGLHQPDENAR